MGNLQFLRIVDNTLVGCSMEMMRPNIQIDWAKGKIVTDSA